VREWRKALGLCHLRLAAGPSTKHRSGLKDWCLWSAMARVGFRLLGPCPTGVDFIITLTAQRRWPIPDPLILASPATIELGVMRVRRLL